MAYERTKNKIKGDSLDAFVQNLSDLYTTQLSIKNADEEFKFVQSVANDNLSLSDQLAYRKEQLKGAVDKTEKQRIKNEISNLNDRIEQKQFSDTYLDKLVEYESGLSSIDTIINYLNDQKASATDPSIIDAINKELVSKNSIKFNLTSKLISDKTEYAIKDKSVEIINDQINSINSEKAKALLAGNDGLVASLDLQLQSLNKAKTESSIERDIKNFAASNITGYSTAVNLLDAYNGKINGATDNTPITIGDVTYSSAKEFWTFKRDSFISDQSSSGLFSRLESEVSSKIQTAGSKNLLTTDNLKTYSNEISNLNGRPELAGYESKIDSTKQSVLQEGANLISDKVINKYAVDYDLNKATVELSGLRALGVNTDSAYAKIVVAGANVKSGQVNNILSAAQNALANDPNLTPEQAILSAISSGAGIVQSPQELADKPAGNLASDLANTQDATSNTNDPRLSTPQINQPIQNPTTQPTTSSGYKTITVNPGETLAQIAARELGSSTKFTDIATLNNISNPDRISAGQVLKIPTASTSPTPTPTSTPTPTPTPTSPTPTPTPQPPKSTYNGSSIVDYLASVGQDSSYTNRAKIAASKGITGYQGSKEQNTTLLKQLRGF